MAIFGYFQSLNANTDLCEVLMLDDWLEPIECTFVYVHVCVRALLNTKSTAVYD